MASHVGSQLIVRIIQIKGRVLLSVISSFLHLSSFIEYKLNTQQRIAFCCLACLCRKCFLFPMRNMIFVVLCCAVLSCVVYCAGI